MNKYPNNLDAYLRQLEGREEITESEFRSLVRSQIERQTAFPSSPFFQQRAMKKAAIFILIGLTGAGIFWSIQKGGQNSTAFSSNLHSGNNTSVQKQILPEPEQTPSFQKEGSTEITLPQSISSHFGITKNLFVPEDMNESWKRSTESWGYHFTPGQKLWYKRIFDHTDSTFGDSYIITTTALVEIENVDRYGNATMVITVQDESNKWKDQPIPHAKGLSQVLGAIPKLRVTITPFGQVLSGTILQDYPTSVAPKNLINNPDFERGYQAPDSVMIEAETAQWFPKWPERELFNSKGHAIDTVFNADTAITMFILEPPNSRTNRREEADGDTITSKPNLIAGRTKEAEAAERKWHDSVKNTPFVTFTQEIHERTVASSNSPDDLVRITDLMQKRTWWNSIKRPSNIDEGTTELVFRPRDGVLTSLLYRGTHSNGSGTKPGTFRIELQLIREEIEMPKERGKIEERPSLPPIR